MTITVRGVGGQQQQQGPYCNNQGVCFPGGQGGHGHGHGHGHGPQGGQGGW